MITDNPDTNSSPAESPSSRPMTLRQQLTPDQHLRFEVLVPLVTAIVIKRQEEKGKLEKADESKLYDKAIAAIDRYSQEIAREARLDELTMALDASKADNFPTDMLEVCSWIVKRLSVLDPKYAELTQKPSQPLAEEA